MIAIDANLLICAAKLHTESVQDLAATIIRQGAERLIRRRSRLSLIISEMAAGQALAGSRSIKEQAVIATYLAGMTICEDTREILVAAAAFRRLWPDRSRRKFVGDCVIYVSAAFHHASAVVTWDKGFLSSVNKSKFMQKAKETLPSSPEPIMPTDKRIGVTINPKRRSERDSITEHRARAERLAAGYVGNDPWDQAQFFRGVVVALGLKVKSVRRPARRR